MKRIISLKFQGNGEAFYPARAHLVLGDHFLDDKDVLLTLECVTANELRSEGERLKRLIDDAVKKGTKKFEESKR